MDFVVVGFGLGALAILLGVLMHGWLARRWERIAARAVAPDDRAAALAVAGWRRDAGQALSTAGSALLIATVGALAGGLHDQTGALLITTTATVAALGLLLWGYLYRLRHPAPPERRSRTAAASLPPASARLALPVLGDDTFAAGRLNGSRNGGDHPLDEAEVRVVALDETPAEREDVPSEIADVAPDPDQDLVANAPERDAEPAADEHAVVALAPPVRAAAPDDDDPE